MVGWGDPQDETIDGGLGFEVMTGLGVGNMPNNPNKIIDHGFGLEVGNSFGVAVQIKARGGCRAETGY